MVDTKKTFRLKAGPYTGRKYLCQDCVRFAADALDFPTIEYAQTLEDNVQELKQLTLELEARLEHYAHLDEVHANLLEIVKRGGVDEAVAED